MIEDSIKDVYGCSFLRRTMNGKVSQISEIAIAHSTVLKTIDGQRPPFSKEFMENVFPILEVAVQWDELRKSKRIPAAFLERCKERFSASGSNFRGTMFEIDMATRCLLSNWKVDFPEDYTKKGRQIDLLIKKTNGKTMALECGSKRGTEAIDVKKVNETVECKTEKFHPKYLERLNVDLEMKAIILDLTRNSYETPQILANVGQIKTFKDIDGVVLTWREDTVENENHSLRIRYKSLGGIPNDYFSTTWAAEFHKGPVFFLRKYVEPEPKHGDLGKEETL